MYGRERKSKATEKRPNQHTKKKECAARLNFYLGADGLFRLTGFNEVHNHIRTHSTYLQETEKIRGERSFNKNRKICELIIKGGGKAGS